MMMDVNVRSIFEDVNIMIYEMLLPCTKTYRDTLTLVSPVDRRVVVDALVENVCFVKTSKCF